ncbi:MAG: hypothetical protein KC535_00665 [Nanoarchaeota archaeon]|nr:hypothetical protein [Nanoarchaeota archaeon]
MEPKYPQPIRNLVDYLVKDHVFRARKVKNFFREQGSLANKVETFFFEQQGGIIIPEVKQLNEHGFQYAFKTEEQGIQDLQYTLNQTPYENAFLFFPEIDLWVGIGEDVSIVVKQDEIFTQVKSHFDFSFIENLGVQEVTFTHYHPHQKWFKLLRKVRAKNKQQTKRDEKYTLEENHFQDKKQASPSEADIQYLWSTEQDLTQKRISHSIDRMLGKDSTEPTLKKINHKIVSETGITTYRIRDDNIVKRSINQNSSKISRKEIDPSQLLQLSSLEKRVEDGKEIFENQYLTIEYQPF